MIKKVLIIHQKVTLCNDLYLIIRWHIEMEKQSEKHFPTFCNKS